MINSLASDWRDLLQGEFQKPYFQELIKIIEDAYRSGAVCPPAEQVFNAFALCPFNTTKVVIIGQDPYHGPGQAHGLCFSVNDGISVPPSLKNIFKELSSDIEGFSPPSSGNLESWAKQGVLLLNAVLTVKANSPGSHAKIGWELFTDRVISLLNEKKEHLVFMLWGNYAVKKAELIDADRHLILTAAHPSPLARGAFFGNRHFSKCNTYLKQKGLTTINWHLHR